MRLSFAESGAAILLPLTVIAVFPFPEGASATGLALAWLVFMAVAALPAAFLESALVRRARQMPYPGIAQLTRDADARTAWRGLIPFSLVMLAALAALASAATVDFMPAEPEWLGLAAPWLLLALASVMVWAGVEKLLGLGGLLAAGSIAVSLFLGESPMAFSLPDARGWQHAAFLALLAGGSGIGLQAWLAQRRLTDAAAASAVVPFLGVQAVSGVLIFMAGDLRHQPAACAYVVPALFAVALMLHVLVQQLTGKGYARPAALGAAVAVTGGLTFLAMQPTFSTLVQLLGLLPLLGLSLFAGWIMKISHVRKALNLPSEGVYNLWRVAVRLVVPGLCLWVMTGVFL